MGLAEAQWHVYHDMLKTEGSKLALSDEKLVKLFRIPNEKTREGVTCLQPLASKKAGNDKAQAQAQRDGRIQARWGGSKDVVQCCISNFPTLARLNFCVDMYRSPEREQGGDGGTEVDLQEPL